MEGMNRNIYFFLAMVIFYSHSC